MNKALKKFTIGAILVATTAFGIGFVGAQDIETGRSGRGCGGGITALAEAAGVENSVILEQWQAGGTLEQIAATYGISVDQLVNDVIASKTARINDKLANGDITQEEADAKLARLAEKDFGAKYEMTYEEAQAARAERQANRGIRGQQGGDV